MTTTHLWYNAPGLEQPQEVQGLHDTCDGKIFVVGCGASLLQQMDTLPRLEGCATWAVNKLPAWKDLPFKPKYFSISEKAHTNRHGIHDFDYPEHPQMKKFAVSYTKVRVAGWQYVARAPAELTVHDTGVMGFDAPLPPLTAAFATVMNSLQLMIWMGFKEIYLLGNEFTLTGYPWQPEARRRFDESTGRRIEGAAVLFRREMEKHGRKLYDCTPGGRLNTKQFNGKPILEYVPLGEAIK